MLKIQTVYYSIELIRTNEEAYPASIDHFINKKVMPIVTERNSVS